MAGQEIATLNISSAAFENEGNIPPKYTCDEEQVSPPLNIDNLPQDTQTLAIIVEDPDAPNGTFDHWIVYNIPSTPLIEEGMVPGISGINSAGKTGYHGPCPPSGSHRYYFNVFALDNELDLQGKADKKQVQDAMEPHIIAKGTLMGRYQKQEQR